MDMVENEGPNERENPMAIEREPEPLASELTVIPGGSNLDKTPFANPRPLAAA
jgi:hypothetical protein